jgi:hypothetical protein
VRNLTAWKEYEGAFPYQRSMAESDPPLTFPVKFNRNTTMERTKDATTRGLLVLLLSFIALQPVSEL